MTREACITENLGLVHACCRRLKGRGVEYDDLFQAGCVGLVKAADRFEPERGLAFSTYAVPVILGELRSLFRESGSVKVGRPLRELGLRALRQEEALTKSLARPPTLTELATALGVDPHQAAEALCAARPALSLTRSGEGEEDADRDLPAPDEQEKLCETLTLQQAVARLNERDRRLMCLRYREELTQAKTAALLGMTQVQVSRREKAILAQIRAWMSPDGEP